MNFQTDSEAIVKEEARLAGKDVNSKEVMAEIDLARQQAMHRADLNDKISQGNKQTKAAGAAYRDISKDAADRIAQLELETKLVGKTGAAAEQYRYELELIQKATDKGRQPSKDQIEHYKQLAAEVGKAAIAFETASALDDLNFERQQMGRSEVEQQIYAQIRDIGVDINSIEGQRVANAIKLNDQLQKQKDALDQTVDVMSSALADLFTKPLKDFDDFIDTVTSGFADLGKTALKDGFKNLLSGQGIPGMGGLFGGAANDNDPLRTLGKTVEGAAAKGTAAGAETGFGGAFGDLFSPKNMKMLGAGLGGFGMGYQSQSPLMGGLGGAVSGFMTAGPIGGVIGGLAGLLGGWLGGNSQKKKEKNQAKDSIEDSLDAIKAFIDQGMGRGAGVYRPMYVEYATQANKYRRTAKKAGDNDLVREIDAAKAAYKKLLQTDFKLAFGGAITAMKSGLGSNSPFMQAQQGIVGLRDELKNFIADAKWAGSSVSTARAAARAYALSMLTGAKELSPMEAEMQKVRGTAAGLKNTLMQLGMSSTDAGKAISAGIATAIKNLRKQYTEDVGKSINELSGKAFINDMMDAGDVFKTRHKDAKALGLSDSLAYRELGLKLADIASQADLTAAELTKYAESLGLPSVAIKIALKELPIAEAKQWASTLVDLKTRLLVAQTNTDTLTGALKVFDRQQYVERMRLKEQGATAAVLIALDKAVAAERLNIIADFNRRTIETTKSALDQAIDAFKAFADGIKEFRDSIKLNASYSTFSPKDQLLEAKKQYQDLLAKANMGDRDAMSKLTGAGQSYLDQAKNFYGSSEAYAKIFNAVDLTLKQAGDKAAKQVTAAEKQIDLLSKQVSSLKTVNDSVLTVAQLTKKLTDAVLLYKKQGGKGFASGGYTGDYGINQPVGVVHGREYVMPAQQTARYMSDLEAMRAGRYSRQVVAPVISNDNGRGGDNAAIVAELRELRKAIYDAGSGGAKVTQTAIGELADRIEKSNNDARVAADQRARARR